MFGKKELDLSQFGDYEFCPLIQDKCATHKCAWYKGIRGTNPNSEEVVNRYECAISVLPLLIVQSSMMTRNVGAEVNEVRKETIKQNTAISMLLFPEVPQPVLEAPPNGTPKQLT